MYAKLFFSNNETLTLSENQIVYGIKTTNGYANISSFLVDSHHHAGLTPAISELLSNYTVFQLDENSPTSYVCSSVVKFELHD